MLNARISLWNMRIYKTRKPDTNQLQQKNTLFKKQQQQNSRNQQESYLKQPGKLIQSPWGAETQAGGRGKNRKQSSEPANAGSWCSELILISSRIFWDLFFDILKNPRYMWETLYPTNTNKVFFRYIFNLFILEHIHILPIPQMSLDKSNWSLDKGFRTIHYQSDCL